MQKRNITCLILSLILVVPAAMAQSSSCASVPATNTFNAALVGTPINGSPNGFSNVNFALNGTQATVTVRSLGVNNITGITLFQGTPGTAGAVPVQTFSVPSNSFSNTGQFTGSVTLDQNLINQIQANPGNFFFAINTTQFPNGAVAGSLMPSSPQLLVG